MNYFKNQDALIFILINFADMNRGTKILKTLLLVLAAFAFIRCGERILGKDKVANIMYDMFVVDEYAKTYNEVNLAADSILLYQHIFEKYGCTLEDYQRSIRHYLQDEKDFIYILDAATRMAKVNASKESKILTQEKPRLYFPIPFKAPVISNLDGWWNKNLQGERIRREKFFEELQKVMVKEGNPAADKTRSDSPKNRPSFEIDAR